MKFVSIQASSGRQPAAPTIGTATAGSGQATVTFTPSSYLGKPIGTNYIVTSTPSSITASGTSSPIVVTGLSNGTSYTFKVKLNNGVIDSLESASSNSVTPSGAAPPPPPPPPPEPPPEPPQPPPGCTYAVISFGTISCFEEQYCVGTTLTTATVCSRINTVRNTDCSTGTVYEEVSRTVTSQSTNSTTCGYVAPTPPPPSECTFEACQAAFGAFCRDQTGDPNAFAVCGSSLPCSFIICGA